MASASPDSTENASPGESWRLPGEYYFDGVKLLGNVFPREAIQRAKDLHFRSDDILVMTYPKSGQWWFY